MANFTSDGSVVNKNRVEKLWLLICSKIQQMSFISSKNELQMFNKWCLYSAIDFYVQERVLLLGPTNGFKMFAQAVQKSMFIFRGFCIFSGSFTCFFYKNNT